jgi:hypothetical protein
MPYNPAQPDVFRDILRRLSEEQFLSSQKIIDLVRESRRGKVGLAPFDMTRNGLDRFKKGERIRSVRGLQEIWLVLEAHPDYGHYFLSSPGEFRFTTADMLLPAALRHFFLANGSHSIYDLAEIGDGIIGSYIMYRPHWRPRIPFGLARSSFVRIWRENSSFNISETQDFAATDEEGAFVQHDVGAMASFGQFIYFLMKEEHAPGTAVKFGFVDLLFPHSGASRADWLRGIVFTSSTMNVFPLGKFFCRRTKEASAPKSNLMKIEDIPDADARAYLMEPLHLPH